MKKTTTATNNYMKSLLAQISTFLAAFSSRGTYNNNHLAFKVKIMQQLPVSNNHLNNHLNSAWSTPGQTINQD